MSQSNSNEKPSNDLALPIFMIASGIVILIVLLSVYLLPKLWSSVGPSLSSAISSVMDGPVRTIKVDRLPASAAADNFMFTIDHAATSLTMNQQSRLVSFRLTVKNNSKEQQSLVLTRFSLITSGGLQFESEPISFSPERLNLSRIHTGASTRGYVSFIIPKDEIPIRLIIDPNPFTQSDLHVDFEDRFRWRSDRYR